MEFDKTEDFIGRLSRMKPMMSEAEAEALTDAIMEQLPSRTGSRRILWMRVVRNISAAAAVFLAGLFLWQGRMTDSVGATDVTAAESPRLERYVSQYEVADSREKRIELFRKHNERSRRMNEFKNVVKRNYYANL
ncbi:MAG: hypothetical protein J5732_01325 [Bacteroidaceae bacterium]|nr:hypothetical protein [Bacteroidaceae bacterium]